MSLKIAITSPYVYPSVIGGAEKYVYCLARSMAKLGLEVVVLTSKPPKGQPEQPIQEDVKTVFLNPLLSIGANPLTIGLLEALKRERPNIIHMQAPTLCGDLSVGFGRLLRIPVITTFHGGITRSSAPSFLLKLYNTLYPKLSLNHCDHTIVTTQHYMSILEQMGVRKDNMSIVPVGVERSFIDSVVPQASENAFDALISKSGHAPRFRLLFVGALDRHHAYKGVECLLKALKLVIQRHSDVLLVVAGDGDRKTYYADLASNLGIDRYVLFAGWMPDELLLTAYSRCDLFVLPSSSHSEGFGIVLLEAMSRGCPVLTTTCAGGAEAVHEAKAGIVVESADPVLVSKAILRFIEDEDFAEKCGKNGLNAVALKYTWDTIAKRILKVYNQHARN